MCIHFLHNNNKKIIIYKQVNYRDCYDDNWLFFFLPFFSKIKTKQKMRFLTIATAALCFATVIQALPYNRNNDQFTKRDGGDNDDEKATRKTKRSS